MTQARAGSRGPLPAPCEPILKRRHKGTKPARSALNPGNTGFVDRRRRLLRAFVPSLKRTERPSAGRQGARCAGPGRTGAGNDNGGRCRHRPPLVPALTAVAGSRGHLSLGGFGKARGPGLPLSPVPERGREAPFGPGGSGRAEARAVSVSSHRGRSPSGRPSDRGAARRPCHNPGTPLPRPKPVRAIPSGSRLRPKPSPSPVRLRTRGDSRGLRRFGRSATLRRAFWTRHGDFVKSRLASACANAGAASSAPVRPPSRSPASLGERRRPLRRAVRPSSLASPFPVRRPFRPRAEAVSFRRVAKVQSACGKRG